MHTGGQIRALQDEGRARAQAWASAEGAFMDRTATAEETARAADLARSSAEQKAASLSGEVSPPCPPRAPTNNNRGWGVR